MRKAKNTIIVRRAIFLGIGWLIFGGTFIGFGTGSVGWGICGAAVGFCVGYIIGVSLRNVWTRGLHRHELLEALVNFEKYNRKNKCIYFLLGERGFDIYWKQRNDDSYVMALQLPLAYWRDMIRETDLKVQLENISGNVCNTGDHVTAEAPEGPEQVLALSECVLETAGGNLEDLKVDTNLPSIFNIGLGYFMRNKGKSFKMLHFSLF